ncbi:MAG: GNAT family N-acetyltransferase [Propionibacteriales bacterium]|nr:GNAT family N-acetyltransferase [Propionibacteriales bacterium]
MHRRVRAVTLHLSTAVTGLSLIQLTSADVAVYYELVDRNREHLSKHGDYQSECEATPQWVVDHLAALPVTGHCFGMWLDGGLIGRVDLVPVDPPRYGFGYWVDHGHSRRGLMTSAYASALRHARDDLQATDVFAGVTHGNDGSVALLRRLGFERIAQLDDYDRFQLTLAADEPR